MLFQGWDMVEMLGLGALHGLWKVSMLVPQSGPVLKPGGYKFGCQALLIFPFLISLSRTHTNMPSVILWWREAQVFIKAYGRVQSPTQLLLSVRKSPPKPVFNEDEARNRSS